MKKTVTGLQVSRGQKSRNIARNDISNICFPMNAINNRSMRRSLRTLFINIVYFIPEITRAGTSKSLASAILLLLKCDCWCLSVLTSYLYRCFDASFSWWSTPLEGEPASHHIYVYFPKTMYAHAWELYFLCRSWPSCEVSKKFHILYFCDQMLWQLFISSRDLLLLLLKSGH